MKKKCSHLFDLGGFLITELSTKLLLVTQLVLERVSIALKLVPSLHLALQLGVLVRKLLCVVDHLLNVLGRQPVLVVGDGDLFLGASALVLGGHNQDAVGINLKGNLNLWNSPWCRGDVGEVELAKLVVILGHGPLSLEHLDGDSVLVVGGSGEDLRLLGGDDGVP